MKRYSIKSIRGKTKRVILIGLTFLITYMLVAKSFVPTKYDLSVGDIAPADIKATRETVDEAESKIKLDEALKNVGAQYSTENDVKKQAEASVLGLIEKAISIKTLAVDDNEKVASLQKYEPIALNSEECKALLGLSKEELLSLEKSASNILEGVYSKNIEDKSEIVQSAIAEATNEIDGLNLADNLKDVFKKVITGQIKPNVLYDKEKTEEKKKEVEKNTEKVIIKKNQIIVKEGEPVTENQIQILTDLGVLSKDSSGSFKFLYFILAVFVGLILYVQHSYIKLNYKGIYDDIKKLTLINLINVLSLIIATVVGRMVPYLIPLACGPILMTLLINYKISIFVSTLNALVIGTIVQEPDSKIMVLAVLNALLGATVLRKVQQRNDILYASIKILILSGICSFSIGVMYSSNIKDILLNTGCVIVGVFVSGILAIGLLPFLEASFDLVTTLKLLELSNPNSPLMKKLLMEAPGTYHHSMVVANLAEMAAEEVNADPVVARIGAYYHDIGKTVRPYFFKENQLAKENPHDKISPNLSTLIIISHVKDGLELAKEHKLPKVIQDMIVEHHGTTLVKYFYYTVKNNSEHPEDVKEEDYRYLGPIPSSKESGILMLADSTEAAVRSINEPTKGKIEEMVNNILKDKLNSGQLDDCDLTLKDLEKIRKCFLKALNGIYHQRIEYPTEKIKDLGKK